MLDGVLAGLGGPSVDAVVLIHDRWSELVGVEVAAHVQPVSIEDGCLRVVTDGPAWASHLKWAEAEIVTDRETILRGTVSALESLERACSWEGEGDVRVRRDRLGVWVHYVESLGLWGAFVRREERHVCLFGVNPESNNPLPCDLEVTIAPEGIDPKATGVFARRDGDPGLYLVVRGLREGRSVAMPPSLLDMLDGGVSVMRDGAEMRGLVVGNVYSPELPTHVAGLAMELKRFNEVLL